MGRLDSLEQSFSASSASNFILMNTFKIPLKEVVLVQLNRDDEMGLNIHELGNPAHNETEDRSSNLDQHFRAGIQVSRLMVIQQLSKSSGPSLNFQ